MANNVVVLGPCGAGKSSMLNKYLERPAFVTSNRIDEDGTKIMVAVDGFVDTPGLDTVNATSISSARLREMLAPKFSVVLVVPKTITRITMWKTRFQGSLDELCFPGGKILVVWTFPGATKQEDHAAIDRLCQGRVCTHVDSEAEDFRQLLTVHFADHSCNLRQSMPQALPQPPAVRGERKSALLWADCMIDSPKSAVPAPRNPRLPAFNHILPKNCLSAPLPATESSVRKVFADVKAMKGNDVNKYNDMKKIGDALLDFLVLTSLHRDGRDLTEGKEAICGNGDDQPMAKLYDRWKLKLAEGEDLNGHSKADALEAMLGYSLYDSNFGALIAQVFAAIYKEK
jgi:hypothetical protein